MPFVSQPAQASSTPHSPRITSNASPCPLGFSSVRPCAPPTLLCTFCSCRHVPKIAIWSFRARRYHGLVFVQARTQSSCRSTSLWRYT